MGRGPRQLRLASGSTLVELLVVTLISSLLSTLALSALIACMKNSSEIRGRVEVNESLERTLERIGQQIRAGEILGDEYRSPGTLPRAQCSNTTLVVQVPITDQKGFNTFVNDLDASGQLVKRPNVETIVYHLLPIWSNAGMYKLVMTKYPGTAVPGYTPKSVKSQTLLSNIIGPRDIATGWPKIFQYIKAGDTSGTAYDTVDSSNPEDYNLVVINLESKKKDAKGKSLETIGLKAEYYLHNSSK